MKLVIAILVGIVLGLAISAFAQVWGWESGAHVMSLPRPYRVGYAAGASDMLGTVANIINDTGSRDNPWFIKQDKCLAQRRGGDLDQFTDFAETLWRGRDYQAANILLTQACK